MNDCTSSSGCRWSANCCSLYTLSEEKRLGRDFFLSEPFCRLNSAFSWVTEEKMGKYSLDKVSLGFQPERSRDMR